jgi:DNA repair photolyase
MEKFKGKAIYQPSGKAAEYSAWACNFYVGCSNSCEYCYLKKGRGAAILGGNMPVLKKCFEDQYHALEVFKKELKINLSELQKHGLFFSFSTDPMLPETIELTVKAINESVLYNVPVKILTKVNFLDDSFMEKFDFLFPFFINDSYKPYIAFGFTLTGHDELEHFASPNADRVQAIKKLSKAGFKTFASIEPVIDFNSAKEMILSSSGYCDLYMIGLESGKKYDINESQRFVEWLNEFASENYPRIYLKKSLQKLSRYTNEYFGCPFVNSDYNIFNEVK